jgi:hypothetical protein
MLAKGHPEVFEIPGFRVALAIASLPGMTLKLFNGFRKHHTRGMRHKKNLWLPFEKTIGYFSDFHIAALPY